MRSKGILCALPEASSRGRPQPHNSALLEMEENGSGGVPGRLPECQRRFLVIHYSWKDRRAQDESRRDPSCLKIKMIFLAVLYSCKVSPRGAWESSPGTCVDDQENRVWVLGSVELFFSLRLSHWLDNQWVC